MSFGLAFAHIVLATIGFLVSLNGYLRGAKKSQIDAALSIVLIMTLGTVLWRFGWLAAVVALVMSLVYVVLTKPVAAGAARRSLGFRTASESPHSVPISPSVDELLQRGDETERRIQRIAMKPGVAEVLQERNMGVNDLIEQFWFLQRIGIGEVAWDVISQPDDLKMLLELRAQELPPLEIASRIIR